MKTTLPARHYSFLPLLKKFPKATFLLLILLGGFLPEVQQVSAQTAYAPVPPIGGANSAINRGPNGAAAAQRTAIIYPPSEVASYPANIPVKSVGFSIMTPSNIPATGNIKLYMANTTDVTYTKSTAWATILSSPTPMTLVYDGPLTVPDAAGFFDITLTTPFTLTAGNGFYLAYEWTTITQSAASATYNCNNQLPASIRTQISTTGTPPATLTGTNSSSNFRPILRLGYTPPGSDIKVVDLFTMGKIALSTGTPHQVQAMVANLGTSPAAALPVTLAVTGANPTTSTVTIPALAAGDTTMVTFPAYSPATAGTNTLTVSVPNDGFNANNSATATQLVTQAGMGYAHGNPPAATNSVGFTGVSSGTFLSKFHTVNTVSIPTVRLYISGNTNLIGKTVYAVVVDTSGAIVGRSPDRIISGGDLDALIPFSIAVPPSFTDVAFYAGMAVPAAPAGTVNQFPLGTQPEQYAYFATRTATRPQTYFVGTLAGGTKPTHRTNLSRFIIEADMQLVSGMSSELASNSISVFPNPTTGKLTINLNGQPAEKTSVTIRNITGQVVKEIRLTSEKTVLELQHLAKGVYQLQISNPEKIAVKHLVIN